MEQQIIEFEMTKEFIERFQQVVGRFDADLDHQRRIGFTHALQDHGKLRPDEVLADPDGEPLPFGIERQMRALLRTDEVAGLLDRIPARTPLEVVDEPR